MNWNVIKVVIVLIITFAILGFIRSGTDFDMRAIIPFFSGRDIGLYDWAGLVLVVFVWWGLARLRQP